MTGLGVDGLVRLPERLMDRLAQRVVARRLQPGRRLLYYGLHRRSGFAKLGIQ
jgi:hypothetical protein